MGRGFPPMPKPSSILIAAIYFVFSHKRHDACISVFLWQRIHAATYYARFQFCKISHCI